MGLLLLEPDVLWLRALGREARAAFRHGMSPKAAARVVGCLREAVPADAVAMVGRGRVLAFSGEGEDHHRPGDGIATELTRQALASGDPVLVEGAERIGCPRPDCTLTAALVVPLRVRGLVAGAVKLYRAGGGGFTSDDLAVGVLLGEVLAAQLEAVWLERLVEEERRVLRSEINPHFLFNTLTAAAGLCGEDPAAARRLLSEFAGFLRAGLRDAGELVPLRDELAFVEQYLAFERVRLGGRLRVESRIDPAVEGAQVPALSVEPLVENAVQHGVAGRPEGGRVEIAAFPRGAQVWVEVRDDGPGVPPGTPHGFGLRNVNRRLKSVFGPGSGLSLRPLPGGGTCARLRVPQL
jgi:LytS/YehU family sensor histidine kinase